MRPEIAEERAALAAQWRELGLHGTETLPQAFARSLPLGGELIFHSEDRPGRYTLAQLHSRAEVVAGALAAMGVGPGDVVAVQLPNWLESVLLFHASLMIGAVLLPIVPIYGPHELGFILKESQAKVLFVPGRWRNVDYGAHIAKLGGLPQLGGIVSVEGALPGATAWEDFLQAQAPVPPPPSDPDAVCVIVYTSGTTASPKGVKHTHNTLLAEIGPDAADRATIPYINLGLWPAGHIASMLSYLNLYMGNSRVTLLEQWDGAVAARLVEETGTRFMSGTPFFLINMAEAANRDGRDLSSLGSFMVGGAAVTPADVRRCNALGFACLRCYGSSEHPTATASLPTAPLEKRADTDGLPSPGTRVRILDHDGNEAPPGVSGEVLLIGPEQFVGYVDPALDDSAFLPGGWFRTGDVGYLDEEGYLTITDRMKDIIIRGGENISAKEVENILLTHPAILEAACVAMPDPVYGERVCAFLILRAGAAVDLPELRDHFLAAGAAKQKIPERVEIVGDLPRTPSGKVKKNVLRDQLRRPAEKAVSA